MNIFAKDWQIKPHVPIKRLNKINAISDSETFFFSIVWFGLLPNCTDARTAREEVIVGTAPVLQFRIIQKEDLMTLRSYKCWHLHTSGNKNYDLTITKCSEQLNVRNSHYCREPLRYTFKVVLQNFYLCKVRHIEYNFRLERECVYYLHLYEVPHNYYCICTVHVIRSHNCQYQHMHNFNVTG